MHEKNRLVSLKRYTGTKAMVRSPTDFLLKNKKNYQKFKLCTL